jgi:hypothetical protein
MEYVILSGKGTNEREQCYQERERESYCTLTCGTAQSTASVSLSIFVLSTEYSEYSTLELQNFVLPCRHDGRGVGRERRHHRTRTHHQRIILLLCILTIELTSTLFTILMLK